MTELNLLLFVLGFWAFGESLKRPAEYYPMVTIAVLWNVLKEFFRMGV